ncbi:MAG: hypothetical protein EHM61_04550 [Acidobacteria bacterium]|nr:MAG: hypothetical protein EHM61_04550 [Acidobacteriota bacterium]
MDRHPGIRIDRIPVTWTIAGLLFVLGTLFVFLVGLPVLRYFLLIGLVGGLLVGVFRYYYLRRDNRDSA